MGGALQQKPNWHLKKRRSNPYAERGLDKFALLSAELEAKRGKLVAQFGTSLSLVRFVIGSDHCNWIPVIVCPTLSKAELRVLRRTATRLVVDDDDSMVTRSSANDHQICTSNGKSDLHTSDTKDQPSHTCAASEEDDQTCNIGTLNCLLTATERFLWMAAFTFSVAIDIISSAVLSKRHADAAPQKGVLPSARRSKQENDIPPANSTSLTHLPSLPPIRTHTGMSRKDTKAMTPTHPATAHAEAPTTRNRHKGQGFSTAPSTPRDSRHAKKSFHASVSFPTTTRMRDEAPCSDITKGSKFLKSTSFPKTSCAQESNPHHVTPRSHTSMSKKRGRKERSENLGQTLAGAGLALGLGGLVMGYIPAIMCIVCWWYALPGFRKAMGDEPHVKSHHV